MDRSKGNKRNWILVWEDGFCDFAACGVEPARPVAASSSFLSTRQLRANDHEPETMNPELFFKMSHEVYNYGEGLMGKVAVDNSHKWVYKEPLENEISFLSPWHASLDPHPRTWEAQFKAGIQTIAVVAVQEGVLQLGSIKRVMEDLSFILYMQRKFNFLHSVPGAALTSGSCCGTKRPLPAMLDSHSQLTLRSVTAPDPWQPMSNTAHTPFTGTKCPPENLKEYTYFDSSSSKALNTGYTSPQGALLLPGMSSLQALLSKLPSVTDDAKSPIHGLGVPFPISRSMTKPEVKVMDCSSTSEADTVEHPPHHHHASGSTFLELLNEYGMPEALENGDSSYSSFLNEICS